MHRQLIAAGVVILIALASAHAQTPTVETPTCNEEFARFLVDQQVSESRTVEQTDKRIRILIRAAEFLWKYDQPTAREYFTEAYKVATDRFRERGFEVIENKGLTTQLPDYRFEVLRAIAAKDGDWSKKLIDQLLKEYEKAAAERKDFEKGRELQELVRMAREVVKTNPDLTRALLRRVMNYPLDFHWFFALHGIADDNRSFADSMYVEALTNYGNASPRRLLFLSAYPFATSRLIGPEKGQYSASVPDDLTPNRILQQRFIETFIRRVISFSSDPQNLNLPAEEFRKPEPVYMVGALSELEAIVLQQFPALIAQFSEAKARATSMLTEQMRKDLTDSEKRNESLDIGFEERLMKVEKADAEGKLTDMMIVNLLTFGSNKLTEEQFKQIEPWLDKIKEDSTRSQAINYFWYLRAQLAIKEYRLSDAERFGRKVPEVEHRAMLFFEIASAQLKNANDAASVYSTLREVGRLAESSETSVEKARVLLALSNQYISINSVFAMQELSDSIAVINQLEDPTKVMSTSVTRQIRGKDFASFTVYSLPGQNLEGTFKAISKDSFEMSLSNAKSLADKYLRTLAVLAVAQNCVDKIKKPAPKAAKPKG